MSHIQYAEVVPQEFAGHRLDQVLAVLFKDYSRSCLQKWVKEGAILVDGQCLRAKDKLKGGEQIVVAVDFIERVHDQPEAIELDILYEDDAILVINKPAGLVVHPGAGNHEGTLLNALLHHTPSVAELPRAGLVHRLDKDTTGVMVVAKTLLAQTALVAALQAREVKREYEAVVVGEMVSGFTVDAPMGRHPKQRTKMAVVRGESGKEAISHVRVIERYPHFTHVAIQIETGRTHQIRVHLAHSGYPIVGDPLYGKRLKNPPFNRQALHARQLTLMHPVTHKKMSWKAPTPEDMQLLCELLAGG